MNTLKLQTLAAAAALNAFRPDSIGKDTAAALIKGGFKVEDNKVSGKSFGVTQAGAKFYLAGVADASPDARDTVYGTPCPGFFWSDGKPVQAGQVLDGKGLGRTIVCK
jgi:hypothetical protein